MSSVPSILIGPRGLTAASEAGGDLQQMLARMIFILRQRCWLFVLPLLAGTLAGLGFFLTQPRLYQVKAVLQRRDDEVVSKLVSNNSPYGFEQLRPALRFDMIGYKAVDTAVTELGFDAHLPRAADGRLSAEGKAARNAMVAELATQLQVVNLENSNAQDLIELRYNGDRPDLGERLIGRLKDNYIRNTSALITERLRQCQSFFADQVETRKSNIARLQAELNQLVSREPEVDPARPDYLNTQAAAAAAAITSLDRGRSDQETDLRSRREYLATLEQRHAAGVSTSRPSLFASEAVDSPRRTRLEGEVTAVLAQIAHAKTVMQMRDAHPDVCNLNKKLRQLRIELERVPMEMQGHVTQSDAPPPDSFPAEKARAEFEIKAIESKLNRLTADLTRAQEQAKAVEQRRGTVMERQQAFVMSQQELASLKGDLNIWTSNLDKINQVMTAEAADRGFKLSTVEEARRPAKPHSPRLANTMMVSGGLGFGLAAALVFLRELLDRSLRHPARVRQLLGIPVLEAIGEIRVGQPGWLRRRGWLWALAGAQALGIALLVGLNWLSVERPVAYAQVISRVYALLTSMGVDS